jgi:hypothetical protein
MGKRHSGNLRISVRPARGEAELCDRAVELTALVELALFFLQGLGRRGPELAPDQPLS